MTTSTINHTEIVQKVELLPIEVLPALDEFIALLQRQIIKQKKPNLIQLGGLFENEPPITDEMIAEARQEMWGSFGEREI